jgi:hypothetical protein
MQRPVKERIKELREEIAEISQANQASSRKRKDSVAIGEQQRRLQRLQEILDELMSLTDWKKT